MNCSTSPLNASKINKTRDSRSFSIISAFGPNTNSSQNASCLFSDRNCLLARDFKCRHVPDTTAKSYTDRCAKIFNKQSSLRLNIGAVCLIVLLTIDGVSARRIHFLNIQVQIFPTLVVSTATVHTECNWCRTWRRRKRENKKHKKIRPQNIVTTRGKNGYSQIIFVFSRWYRCDSHTNCFLYSPNFVEISLLRVILIFVFNHWAKMKRKKLLQRYQSHNNLVTQIFW